MSSTDKDAFEELVIAECGSELWLPEDMPKIKNAFKKYLELSCANWKGNNLIAESEYETIDWAINELKEELSSK